MYLGRKGAVLGLLGCSILGCEWDVIPARFWSPCVPGNRLGEKHSPEAFLVLISLNISVVLQEVYVHVWRAARKTNPH